MDRSGPDDPSGDDRSAGGIADAHPDRVLRKRGRSGLQIAWSSSRQPEQAIPAAVWLPPLPVSQPPTVALLFPLVGQRFLEPDPIRFVAEVDDSNGDLSLVEFFANGQKLARPRRLRSAGPGIGHPGETTSSRSRPATETVSAPRPPPSSPLSNRRRWSCSSSLRTRPAFNCGPQPETADDSVWKPRTSPTSGRSSHAKLPRVERFNSTA